MSDKPIFAEENPFGEISQEQIAGGPVEGYKDVFYLEGYSDKRHERDLAIREGKKPPTLDYRFQYVPVELKAGANVIAAQKAAEGYRPVKYDELESLGIDPALSTCVKGPDGTARVASQMLMVCDGKTAARNFARERARAKDQWKHHVEQPFRDAIDRINDEAGLSARGRARVTLDTETHDE